MKVVTPAEFQALIDARAAENPAFARNTKMLFEHQGEWRKWPLHLQKDVFAKLGVDAVMMPLGPGGVLVDVGVAGTLKEDDRG